MKQASLRRASFAVIVVILFVATGCAERQPVVEEVGGSRAAYGAQQTAAKAAERQQLEERILAATLRIEIAVYAPQSKGGYALIDNSLGHATVMNGRYLVTHNHFSLTLEDLNDGTLRKLSAYAPDGSTLLKDAPFHSFKVELPNPETLVFDFGVYGRQGALGYIGMASAEFGTWQSLDLQPGAMVAQVRWDGVATVIEWVPVLAIRSENGTMVVEMEGTAEKGASGGGIFYNGYHVANNWYRRTEKRAATGQVLHQFTVGALNGAKLLTFAEMNSRGGDKMAAAPAPAVAEMEGATTPQ
ncbi:MAG: hypothetical protein RRC07_11600 [Anaerolineae bacterium]|nr:hypothetical protein [Anaerolineae bacterium]